MEKAKESFYVDDFIIHLMKEFGRLPFTSIKANISTKKGIPFTDLNKKHFMNKNGFLLIDVKSLLEEVKNE